jgi:hypothetical protein
MPMRANASSQNSRTLKEEQIDVNTSDSKILNVTECRNVRYLWHSPVAITKSSGVSR